MKAVTSQRSRVRQQSRHGRPLRLTPRELDVLALLCEGLSNKIISRRLDISTATVKCHISRILSELGASSRLEAVVVAARYGLIGHNGGPAAMHHFAAQSERSAEHVADPVSMPPALVAVRP